MSLFYCTSLLTTQKKHGKKHQNKQWRGMHTCVFDISLQVPQRLAKAESAITTSASWLSKPLTAPMLLPQTATLNPLSFKNLTAMSASLLSLLPSEINCFQVLFPQPSKSKQARPTSGGRSGNCEYPSYLLELLPCKYSKTYLMVRGVQRERGKGM